MSEEKVPDNLKLFSKSSKTFTIDVFTNMEEGRQVEGFLVYSGDAQTPLWIPPDGRLLFKIDKGRFVVAINDLEISRSSILF